MFRVLAFLLLTALALQAAPPVWDDAIRDTWWTENTNPENWGRVAATRMKELAKSYEPSENGELPSGLVGWFNHLRWVSLLTPDEFKSTGLTVLEFRFLSENAQLIQIFLNELRPEDNKVEAIKILAAIYRSAPQDVRTYPNLAVAYALVFDQPFPKDWPHRQAKRMPWEEKCGSPADRFGYYVDLDKRKKLDFPLKDLSFTEVKFLVDSLISTDELTWGREEVRTNLGDFAEVFGSIRYDMPRYLRREFNWPTSIPYTLAEIQKHGGICTDQAFFGVTVGKARGIPTLCFTGKGLNSGHAWYGYLKRNHSWDLNVGRYASQNYPVGKAQDPQTWKEVDDEELKYSTEVVQRNLRYPAAEMLLYWAEANQSQSFYRASIDQVRSMLPEWIQGWRNEAEWMKRTQQPLDVQKEFYRKWLAQFAKLPGARVEGQTRLLELLIASGDTEGAKQIQAELVRQNRRKRFDLGIGRGMDPIYDLLDKEDWKAAESEYKKLVRQFEDQGGSSLFYGVVRPFVLTCQENNQEDLARIALEFASKKMKPEPGSIVEDEFIKLATASVPVADPNNPRNWPSPFKDQVLKESRTIPAGRYRFRGRTEFQKPENGEMVVVFSEQSQIYGGEKIELFLGQAKMLVSGSLISNLDMRADLNGGATFSHCLIRACTIGKSGGGSGGNFASRWVFEATQVEQADMGPELVIEDVGLRATECVFKTVTLPSINFGKTKVSEALGSNQLVVKNSRFIGCEIPLSFLLITQDCSFSGCTFVDDREAPLLDKAVTVQIKEVNSSWNATKPMENLTVEKISIAEFQ